MTTIIHVFASFMFLCRLSILYEGERRHFVSQVKGQSGAMSKGRVSHFLSSPVFHPSLDIFLFSQYARRTGVFRSLGSVFPTSIWIPAPEEAASFVASETFRLLRVHKQSHTGVAAYEMGAAQGHFWKPTIKSFVSFFSSLPFLLSVSM